MFAESLSNLLDHPIEIVHSFQLQLFSDAWFLEAMDSYLQLRLAKKSSAPTYVYLFTHKGSASFSEVFHGGRENFMGRKLIDISLKRLLFLLYKIHEQVLVM